MEMPPPVDPECPNDYAQEHTHDWHPQEECTQGYPQECTHDRYPVEDAGDGEGYWLYDTYFFYPKDDQWDIYFGDDSAQDHDDWWGDDWENTDEVYYDVDEYDDIYATYHEARKKMNDMRLARGFYPIVALAPGPPSQAPGFGGRRPRKGKGKGRRPPPRKGKGRGKGKGKNRPKGKGGRSPSSGRGKGRGGKSKGAPNHSSGTTPADSVCLRCGQKGHWARDCPNQGTKRQRTDAMQVSQVSQAVDQFMMTDENPAEVLEDIYAQKYCDPCEAVLDGGAQSFVVGKTVLESYAEHLRMQGIGWNPEYLTCSKMFRFGNDETSHCTTACIVPVQFAGRTGHLYVHVLPGNTPFLFPRPFMEMFGLIIDYGRKRLCWQDTNWTPVRQKDPKGHYLLHLAEDVTMMKKGLVKPDFSHIPQGVETTVLSIDASTGVVDSVPPPPEPYTDRTTDLKPSKFR